MLRRTDPGWGWGMPHPALSRSGHLTERTRWLWLVPLAAGFLTVLGWVLSHDPGPGLSDRGWLTIAAAAVLVVLLSFHRSDSGRRLLRAVAEYAVVATLAVLLVTAGAPAKPAKPGACPSVLQARAWLTCLWHQASDAGKASGQPSTTTQGRR